MILSADSPLLPLQWLLPGQDCRHWQTWVPISPGECVGPAVRLSAGLQWGDTVTQRSPSQPPTLYNFLAISAFMIFYLSVFYTFTRIVDKTLRKFNSSGSRGWSRFIYLYEEKHDDINHKGLNSSFWVYFYLLDSADFSPQLWPDPAGCSVWPTVCPGCCWARGQRSLGLCSKHRWHFLACG